MRNTPKTASTRHSNLSCFEPLEVRQMMSATPHAVAPLPIAKPASSVVPGEWILSMQPAAASKGNVPTLVRQASSRAGLALSLKRNLSVPGLSLLQAPADASLKSIRAALSKIRGFNYVEPNYRLYADRLPNDPSFPDLYGMHNTGQNLGTPGDDIDMPDAWDRTTGDGSVVVGVIDTGVDYTHPDLAANMWHNPGEIPADGIDNDNDGFVDDVYGWDFANDDNDPFDDAGHGTHVSGTIAGVGNNGVGVTGINWNARIMAIKFLDSTGMGTTEAAVEAINYATMMRQRGVNIRVTNNSWGGGDDSQALQDAIRASGDAGMLFVAAAGNDGRDTDGEFNYPSCYDLPNVISVAATDNNDLLADFSNYGATTVDLGAPGVNILSSVPNNSYDWYSGTSMATPHVVGVAALAWSTKPSASFGEIRDAIFGGTDRIESMIGTTATGGRLNASHTLDLLSATSPVIVFGAGDSGISELNDRGSLTVLRFGDTTSELTIPFTVSGTATNGVDYTLSSTSFTIPAGKTSASITVTPLPDLQIEGDETIQISLVGGTGYALGSGSSISLKLVDHIPAPANDNFADATNVTTATASISASNLGATTEPDEPWHAGSIGEHSVWWNWTAPNNGSAVIHTQGSDFDTLLAVYTGSALTSLTPVASSNGSLDGGISAVDFSAVAGTVYHIAVDGWLGAAGEIKLSIGGPPANDAFASRIPLSGLSPSATGTNLGASIEPGEPDHAGSPGGHSVWWTWTAPASGMITVSPYGSSFPTDLGVYTGNSIASLVPVSSDDSGSVGLSLSFNATAGTTYQIAVDGFYGAVGNITLNIGFAAGSYVSWDGGGDGVNWTDPMNWSDDLVPGPSDDVTILGWTGSTIRITAGAQSVRSLTCYDGLTISGGSLEVAYDSQLYQTTTLSGGELIGRGDVTVNGILNWSGGTMSGSGSTIIGTAGVLNMTGSGVLLSDRPIQIDGAAHMQPGGNLVLRTPALTIDAQASLDLADNGLIVDYSGASPIDQIRKYLTAGFAVGAWNGSGINSSSAARDTARAIGYAEATDAGISAGSIFSGQTIDTTAVVVRSTLKGDANLDRHVDISDLGVLATNWQASQSRWSQGDFNFDQRVDIGDLGTLATNWQAPWTQSSDGGTGAQRATATTAIALIPND